MNEVAGEGRAQADQPHQYSAPPRYCGKGGRSLHRFPDDLKVARGVRMNLDRRGHMLPSYRAPAKTVKYFLSQSKSRGGRYLMI